MMGHPSILEHIDATVSVLFSESDIVGKSRKMKIAEARQLSMFLCRDLIRTSLSNIGVYFGGRDHTTVMHAIKKIEEKKAKKKNIGENIAQITQELTFI